MQVDGSSTKAVSGVGVVVEPLHGAKIIYCIRIGFLPTNNKAKYEALIVGLRVPKSLGQNG